MIVFVHSYHYCQFKCFKMYRGHYSACPERRPLTWQLRRRNVGGLYFTKRSSLGLRKNATFHAVAKGRLVIFYPRANWPPPAGKVMVHEGRPWRRGWGRGGGLVGWRRGGEEVGGGGGGNCTGWGRWRMDLWGWGMEYRGERRPLYKNTQHFILLSFSETRC